MRLQSLLAAAILALEGASAHPTNSHAHLHKLRLRDVLSKRTKYDTSHVNWDEALKDVDWSKVDYDGTGATPSDSSTPSTDTGVKTVEKATKSDDSNDDASKPSSDSQSEDDSKSTSTSESSGGSGSCLDLTKLSKRATHQQDAWGGNSENNIHPTSDCKPTGDYSLTFVNNRGSKKTYWLWNKAGNGGEGFPNGMMIEATKIFDLEDGQSATWLFDAGSLIGFSEDCGRATNSGNVPNCNVGEASFADNNLVGGSDGSSFYDVSKVTNTLLKGKTPEPSEIPMTISAPGKDESSLTQCNYVESTQNSPGNFPPGKSGCDIGSKSDYHVKVTFG